MKGRLRVVFKHFPLGFHVNARAAAIASMCAHRQGKFWPYHDLLFQNMKRLGRADLIGWARVVGLDIPRFEKDFKDLSIHALVRRDTSEGTRAGVRGTPSVYLNGRRVNASVTSVDAVVSLVESEVFKR
jgi:protein-disulfide isomerase